ncbi:MAG: translation initiation inhibitor [Verrucomicrobiae bacterium]|nr:translation initiation inhibitor [Verrucomicrobiae bacterium]NNJ44326.1 translation initiation inhibitor [Akkermansiaceae bacterium]
MYQETDYPMPMPHAQPSEKCFLGDLPVSVQCSRFCGAEGVDEVQWMIRPTSYATFETQLEWVRLAYERALAEAGMSMDTAVWRRFLCSDLLNQVDWLKNSAFSQPDDPSNPCAISWVCQPPAAPSKVTLWVQHVDDPSGSLQKTKHGNTLSLNRGELIHHWTTGVSSPHVDGAYLQTLGIFAQYDKVLVDKGLCLADDVVRTWFFAQNVDANYAGLVTARNEVFAQQGLTDKTHYIASTGIEGGSSEVSARTMMDAYAISGVKPEQITHLHAQDYLSPTHIYGVAFERGTSIAYRDRKHILISGTASIDSHGEILFPGDVIQQLDRTLVNIEALLNEAGASLGDMQVMLVYLRDPNDHGPVMEVLVERFPDTPFECVTAPVCRPGWLIEIEGLAVVGNDAPELPAF